MPLARTLQLIAAFAALVPCWAGALSFQHKDWELACDNTGTCRAAGYQAGDTGHQAVSVLLTRAAGAGQAVRGELKLGEFARDGRTKPVPARLRMAIDGRPLGWLERPRGSDTFALAPAQVDALVAALARPARIMFAAGRDTWRLSADGGAAVLLKMDEAQGRLATVGALLRKGPADESQVPGARPVPVIHVPHLGEPRPADPALADRIRPLLEEDCPGSEAAREPPVNVWRLGPGKVLVESRCLSAMANVGIGYWVANDRPPYQPRLVTADGDYYTGDTIHGEHQGRSAGDCGSFYEWVWNGSTFVAASERSTGMCKGVAAGGAWDLPTLVTEIRRAEGPARTEEKRK